MSVVLMYHGLYRDDNDLSRIDIEDRPYAVREEMFEAQLRELSRYQCGLLNASAMGGEDPQIIITFDDGHVSNYDIALPLLQKYQLPAYFFITTDFIEKRAYFCSWQNLRDMQAAGMIIGSHGKTHGFFADMESSDAIHEFSHSHEALSRELEASVFSISFPGGRYSLSNLEQALQSGYTEIFGSGFGTLQNQTRRQNSAINRIPIRDSTTLEQFNKIIDCDTRFYVTERIKQFGKSSLKKTIGNDRYHALYKFAADRR